MWLGPGWKGHKLMNLEYVSEVALIGIVHILDVGSKKTQNRNPYEWLLNIIH